MNSVLKNARLAKSYKREELALVMGKSEHTVKRWETGARHPRTRDLPKLAEVLGIPVAVIIESLFASTKEVE